MRLILTLCALATPAFSQTFTPLDQGQAQAALTGRALSYTDGAWQDFRASGRTLYKAGNDSWGTWDIRADGQYCSQWPPSKDWSCYTVLQSQDGAQIQFADDYGNVTTGSYSSD